MVTSCYAPPLEDYAFLMDRFLSLRETILDFPDFRGISREDIDLILTEAGRFAAQRVAPVNLATDVEGCALNEGKVSVPAAMRDAVRDYIRGGWLGLTADTADGGQGLPRVVGFMVNEMMSAASISFGDYAGLFASGYTMLRNHVPRDLASGYIADLLAGELGCTQCMTEPHCGSDVGLLRTRASLTEDGRYRLSGTKIFISAGDHDITDNILHFVLARIEGDESGVKGVSLFLVPKILPDGERNGVYPVSVEHKMGYSASATCQLSFEEALGWLICEPGKGLPAMFDMVNAARLVVGAQGLCTADAAYQIAAPYALERLQGRSLSGARHPQAPADPLIVHPDVRRMLLHTRSFVEGARALYLWLGLQVDISENAPDEEERRAARDWLELLTGPAKALMSDLGFDATNQCLQVLGGHGYIRDQGIEQLVRDARLAQIQEGANGLLAANLIRRQLRRNDGRALEALLAAMRKTAAELAAQRDFPDIAASLADAAGLLEEATQWVLDAADRDPEEIGAAGVDFQWLFGLTLLAWIWGRLVLAATAGDAGSETGEETARGKIVLARFFMQRTLPQAQANMVKMKSGAAVIKAPSDAWFVGAKSD